MSARAEAGRPAAASAEAFGALDWALLAGVALTWGGSFLFIELGIDNFKPGLVAFLRVFFGAVTLAMIPAARRSVPRADWPLVALLGVIWMAVPFTLFPIAQQWIESSLAGMINAATPLFTTLVAAILVRHLPGRLQAAGLVIGFLGVVVVASPSFGEGESTALGIGLVLLSAILYGFAFNLAGSLQRRHGALPVIWGAQLVALVLLLPVGAVSATESTFAWDSLLAMVALGSFGTALAVVWFTMLVGRVGASRGSVTLYFVPVVAIVLGALLLDESIALAAVLGTGLVLGGAYLTSREEPARQRGPRTPRARPSA